MINWKENLTELHQKLVEGRTLAEIGAEYGTSRQNMSLVVKKYFPEFNKNDFGAGKRRKIRMQLWQKECQKRFNRTSWIPQDELQKLQSAYFTRKRQNVKSQGKWEFTIEMSDLDWPTHCPVFGTELDWDSGYQQDNSPSIDRTNSREGYIPGNVKFMSWKANRLKNNGTLSDFEQLIKYLKEQEK